jgi:hypothetical protein
MEDNSGSTLAPLRNFDAKREPPASARWSQVSTTDGYADDLSSSPDKDRTQRNPKAARTPVRDAVMTPKGPPPENNDNPQDAAFFPEVQRNESTTASSSACIPHTPGRCATLQNGVIANGIDRGHVSASTCAPGLAATTPPLARDRSMDMRTMADVVLPA